MKAPRISLLDRYILAEFFMVFFVCLFAASALFVVIELFEKMRIFVREDALVVHVVSYLLLKIPLICHLMTPIALLLATLLSVGRLAQLSEITAMRACGVSVLRLFVPLVVCAFLVSLLMLAVGELLVPWSNQKVEDILTLDIKRKKDNGDFNRADFWYRSGNKFYSVAFYDSRLHTLQGVATYELGEDFSPVRRTDAREVVWENGDIGWNMADVVETGFVGDSTFNNTFRRLPMVIAEKPGDFSELRRKPETMGYFELRKYLEKLRGEGVPVTKYEVELASKLAFPFVNLIVVLIAIPFSLNSARSGAGLRNFVVAVSVGLSYYFIHAVSSSFGEAELLPVHVAAWTANILLLCVGGWFLFGAEAGK